MEAIVKEAISREKEKEKKKPEVGASLASDTDEELRRIVEEIKTSIKVVGVGGAGGNTINRLVDMGVEGGEIIAINTDALDLLYTKAMTKLLIGASITGGIGAGNDPELGEQCADSDIKKIAQVLTGADMVFITCGLGGGTGTGAAPVIAEVSKDINALTVAIVTLPFSVEGKVRARNAINGLKKLRKFADTVIVIPNDRLLEVAPNLPLNDAFKVADELLANSVKGITEMITKPGLVNLDFADVRAVLQEGGTALIGLGTSTRDTPMDERARESVERALRSPLLDTDISNAKGALVNIIGSKDMTLEEAEEIVRIVSENISPDAQIIWGAQIDESLDRNIIKTLVILAGVKTPAFEEELEEKVEAFGEEHADLGLREI
ncbi:MAG: cell division protein FtsZ [Candidatus Altiarchaeales archaeon]|nr:MAG: cell division protein FtsZ [Candidatus Altiarchaeales archaeon]RLI94883.1 MAG: cell division protein FtsZ [Candidatus Altiarchaeales archaeon]RLI94981.1 MAG: cell division protein FtsZ [Candidatus Altiarchaeales archaeon]HDO82731.1 cell division protein FtsZ [Candidatus Altiarchaeales archaeon]HEX55380.1 cell division protein FtsZ [Candidatus Altiarchaeales archaeon]